MAHRIYSERVNLYAYFRFQSCLGHVVEATLTVVRAVDPFRVIVANEAEVVAGAGAAVEAIANEIAAEEVSFICQRLTGNLRHTNESNLLFD